jgi:spore maturation protein CgeB
MKIALFYHSLHSCWNNGHAHFLRGYSTSLMALGNDVLIYEPAENWSLINFLEDAGEAGLEAGRSKYPNLSSIAYSPEELDLDRMLEGVDLVIAHEWNEPALISALGRHRARSGYALLFHDTHHRAATAPDEMARFDLSHFDGALVYGEVLREIYLQRGWVRRAWVWHEAADTRIFRPLPGPRHPRPPVLDLVWIGNWGDDERSAELHEYLIDPVRTLGLKAAIYGVRYPKKAVDALRAAAIEYKGWLPNALAPEAFASAAVTVHVPRRPYVKALPGIPTIRVFEALACGIPLVCAPWNDAEALFTPGRDFLVARDGREMTEMLARLLADPREARALADHGLATIRQRHTTDHRARELLAICGELGIAGDQPPAILHPPHNPHSTPSEEVIA